VRYEEAAKDLRQHYEATGSRGPDEAEGRLAHLDAFFTGYRFAAIGPAEVTRYVAKRQAEPTQIIAARDGATITRRLTSNGTINRELGVLGRMLRLAYENGKLMRLPLIRKLKEAAPRQGFFERHQYEAVRKHLAPDLQVACAIAYTFGWRMRSEVLALARRQLDLEAGTLRLEPGSTKNDDGRVVYLTPELKSLLAAQLERIRAVECKTERIIPSLFPYLSGKRRVGQPRREFRKAWVTACTKAGVPGMLRHDFRRTAVRNMERSGVPRSVATKLTGHKTEAVYRRYAIVSDADLRAAALRLGDGHVSGHVAASSVDARPLSV
jgi:integrase